MKRVISLSLFVIFTLGLTQFWNHSTDGFKIHKIQPNFISALPSDDIPQEVFDQKFHYLAKGRQAYVFENKDQTVVLKLLRTHAFTPPFWARIPFSFSIVEKKRRNARRKMDFWLSSFAMAAESLKEESGILFSHLGQTKNLKANLVLYDKLGRKQILNPNQYLFQIQKKVTFLEDALLSMDDPKPIIHSFFQAVSRRLKMGITNESRDYFKNIGYHEDCVVEFDIGEFSQKENLGTAELLQFSVPFRKWLEEYKPSFLPFFDQELKNELTSLNP